MQIRDNPDAKTISWDYFLKSLEEIRPSFTLDIEKKYDYMVNKYTKR